MSRPQQITIAGAGLVGSLLGVMLGQQGYRVRLLERRGDQRLQTTDSGRSINLALSERGIHALKLAGLYDKVQPLLIPMKGRMLHLPDGSTEFMPYGQRPHEIIYSVSRQKLNCVLLDAVEAATDVNAFFDRKVQQIDLEARSLTTVDERAENETSESFEILIGADGAGSPTRHAIIEKTKGKTLSEFLEHDYKELEIPAVDGQHAIEREALHIWPRGGFMLIALPNLDGSFTVTLFLPKTGEVSFESIHDTGELRAVFATQFPDALELMPNPLQDYFQNPTGRLGTVYCSPWHCQGTAMVLGDAAHAIVPFHGQGMNAGFEDCSELLRLLQETDHDWAMTMQRFDECRRPNADAIAKMAIENYVTMRDSVADEQFQLKKQLGFELEKRFPDRFVPRYSMVMFHRTPYAVALERGQIQQEILDQLVAGQETLDAVDFQLAESLIRDRLSLLLDR